METVSSCRKQRGPRALFDRTRGNKKDCKEMNIQEKTFGYFTQEDWLEIKDHIKEVLKEDISNVIKEEYLFDTDYIRDIEKDYLYEAARTVIKDLLNENDIELKKVIKQVIREELSKGLSDGF